MGDSRNDKVAAYAVANAAENIPICDFQESDIFAVAYPKSGSTWFQNLASGLFYSIDLDNTPDALIQKMVPDVHWKERYARLRAEMMFKSHALPRRDYRRVVYLLRDGRDVAVSHFHHRAAVQQKIESELDLAASVREDAERWSQHVRSWTANPFNAAMLMIRYEDLLVHPHRELRRFCKFAGLPFTEAGITEVAQKCSFQVMRKRETKFGLANSAWPRSRSFVRRGEAGSYRDELPEDILQLFEGIAGATLEAFGYGMATSYGVRVA